MATTGAEALAAFACSYAVVVGFFLLRFTVHVIFTTRGKDFKCVWQTCVGLLDVVSRVVYDAATYALVALGNALAILLSGNP